MDPSDYYTSKIHRIFVSSTSFIIFLALIEYHVLVVLFAEICGNFIHKFIYFAILTLPRLILLTQITLLFIIPVKLGPHFRVNVLEAIFFVYKHSLIPYPHIWWSIWSLLVPSETIMLNWYLLESWDILIFSMFHMIWMLDASKVAAEIIYWSLVIWWYWFLDAHSM